MGRVGYALHAARGMFALNLPVSARVRRDFRLDFLSGLFFGVFNGSAVAYIFVVARTIGVSQFGIGVLTSMSAVGCMLSLPISLMIKGGAGRTYLFAANYLSRGILLPLVFLHGPPTYIIAISVFYVAGGTTGPFYAEIMQEVYPLEFRGQLMSLVRIGSGSVMTASSLLTAWLLGSGYITYQEVFGIGAVAAVASTYMFSLVTPVRPAPRPRQSMRDAMAVLWRDRPFALYELWVFVMASGAVMAGTLYPLVIVDKLHTGYGPVGVLSVVSSAGYLLSWFGWGKVVDRTGPVLTMIVVSICGLTLPCSMLIAPGAYWLAPAMFLNGVASGGYEVGPIAAAIYFSRARPHDASLYMALHSIILGARGIVFPFVATLLLAGRHYELSIGTALALSLIGAVMLWRLNAKERRAETDSVTQPPAMPAQGIARMGYAPMEAAATEVAAQVGPEVEV